MSVKIHILCDLHVEFGRFDTPPTEADVIVLAGDVHVKNQGLRWILDQDFNVPVIYVLGNHEFYNDRFPGLIEQLKRDAEGTNVHVLENDVVQIGGLSFFGCTLWSDMALFGDPSEAIAAAEARMNDYRLIRHSKKYRGLTPGDTVTWHKQSVKKLQEFLGASDPERSVVVTHAAPSIKSVPERFREDAITPAFASNLEPLIKEYQPRLWIHGHTHDSFDYKIGRTRIICNPRGYVPTARNVKFNPEMVVRVE